MRRDNARDGTPSVVLISASSLSTDKINAQRLGSVIDVDQAASLSSGTPGLKRLRMLRVSSRPGHRSKEVFQ